MPSPPITAQQPGPATDRNNRASGANRRSNTRPSSNTNRSPSAQSLRVRRPPARTYSTVLITDSIMRQTPDDILGSNHTIHIINKRNTDGLFLPSVRSTLENMRPDFIYIHLGINDLCDMKRYGTIVANYGSFHLYAIDKIPMTRVIFSLPLPTDRAEECDVIDDLHRSTCNWIDVCEGNKPLDDRHVHYNTNSNFRSQNGRQKADLFTRDGIHLTNAGKEQMTKNFRFSIHSITRKIRLRNISRPAS